MHKKTLFILLNLSLFFTTQVKADDMFSGVLIKCIPEFEYFIVQQVFIPNTVSGFRREIGYDKEVFKKIFERTGVYILSGNAPLSYECKLRNRTMTVNIGRTKIENSRAIGSPTSNHYEILDGNSKLSSGIFHFNSHAPSRYMFRLTEYSYEICYYPLIEYTNDYEFESPSKLNEMKANCSYHRIHGENLRNKRDFYKKKWSEKYNLKLD